MKMAFKITGGILMAIAFFLIVGTAGADCDGDCMERALSIKDTLINIGIGLFAGFMGYQMYKYGDEFLD